MHIVFLNPQGNFDATDSHLTEHPDFGGQLVYVKEVAMAMAMRGHRVDIVTRRIEDPDWPEFASAVDGYPDHEKNPRILRISCGGPAFLAKEQLWDHLPEFVDNMLAFYGDQLPDFATAHYADGGYCAALLQRRTGIGYTFTSHSLGAQKLDKLGVNLENLDQMEAHYRFSRRIDAERLSMRRACRIITSTGQEREQQYSHPLYRGEVDIGDNSKFAVIPPGVNTRIFTGEKGALDSAVTTALEAETGGGDGPWIVVSSRLDEKKNIIGVVDAYAGSAALREQARLALCIRGMDNPYTEYKQLPESERLVMEEILAAIEKGSIRDRVRFLNLQSQQELAAAYRYFARRGSVFALIAFYEPFGLAPIEAAACGLACVATEKGGPSEIFEDGSGILVDPFDSDDIARGLLAGVENYSDLSHRAQRRVREKYTWRQTAAGYLEVIEQCMPMATRRGDDIPPLDAGERILEYLENR